MVILETERLVLRELEAGDAPFILELLNDPSFLKYIGDKGVRTLDDARAYIADGPAASYRKNGHGLYHTALKADGVPVGICGLVKRDGLDGPDIGFAFLPAFTGKGYGHESAAAVLKHAQSKQGYRRILAITSPDNVASICLVEKLGLKFVKALRLTEGAPEVKLFALDG